MAILDFSVSGWHGFGSLTQVCFGISVSNFMCMSFVAVGRSLMIVSYVAFKMAALWFWTMFNCNPPIAHCHPFLWGGGILVDHWSTISSCFKNCHRFYPGPNELTWGLGMYQSRVVIGSNNGLSPVQCQVITCNKDHLFSIGSIETNFSNFFLMKIQDLSL